jgi:hypothetical protein
MLIPLGAVLLLAIGWSVYWFVAIERAKAGARERLASLAQNGITLSCNGESWGGYPFRFEYQCSDYKLVQQGSFTLTGSQLLAVAQAYNPWHIILLIDGPTTIIRDGEQPLSVTHQRAIASFILSRDGKELNASSLAVPQLVVPSFGSAAELQFHLRRGERAGLDLALILNNASYAPSEKPPIKVDNVQILATLTPTSQLDITDVQASQDQLKVWGKGKAVLDAENRPEGDLALQTNDLPAVMTIAEPYLNAKTSDSTLLKTALALLGKNAGIPVIARNGELFVGPLKVATLEPLF